MIYNLPSGTKNLKLLFPGINWDNMSSYFVEMLSSDVPFVTSDIYEICRCEDILRINFLNSIGAVEPVNMKNISMIHENESKTYEKSQSGYFNRQQHALSRYNVVANDTYTAYKILTEDKLKYYEELVDATTAWIEWEADYLPIIILNYSFEEFKQEDRFMYELAFQFKLSKSKKTIRG